MCNCATLPFVYNNRILCRCVFSLHKNVYLNPAAATEAAANRLVDALVLLLLLGSGVGKAQPCVD